MKFAIGPTWRLEPLGSHSDAAAVPQLRQALATLLSRLAVPAPARGANAAPRPQDAAIVQRLHWLEIGEDGRLRLEPLLPIGTGLELKERGGGRYAVSFVSQPDPSGPEHALEFDGNELRLRIAHRGSWVRVTPSSRTWILREDLQIVGCDPATLAIERTDGASPAGDRLEARPSPSTAGFELRPRQRITVQLSSLGLPPRLRGVMSAVCRLGANNVRLRIGEDGTLDFSALEVDEVPERVEIEVRCEPPGYPRPIAALRIRAPVATGLSRLELLEGTRLLPLPGDGRQADGFRFHAASPAPVTLHVRLRSGTMDRLVRCEREDGREGRVTYRAPALPAALGSLPLPALVLAGWEGQDDVQPLPLTPPVLTGTWFPDSGGVLRFQPDEGVSGDLTFVRPAIGPRTGLDWQPEDGLTGPAASLWRAALTLREQGYSEVVHLPIAVREVGVVMRTDPTVGPSPARDEVDGGCWLELDAPPSGARAAHSWVSPFEVVSNRITTEQCRVRVHLPRNQAQNLRQLPLRVWIGDGTRRYRWPIWCHTLRAPNGVWRPCRRQGPLHLLPPDEALFVDFRGLTSTARRFDVPHPTAHRQTLLELDAPWALAGGEEVGIDLCHYAPLSAAVARNRVGDEVHYWIEAPGEIAEILYMVARRERGGWHIAPRTPSSDPGSIAAVGPLERVQPGAWRVPFMAAPQDGTHAWYVHWRGYVIEMMPPSRPGVRLMGWIWAAEAVGEWRTPAPGRPYSFADASTPLHGRGWRGRITTGADGRWCFRWETEPPDEVCASPALQQLLLGTGWLQDGLEIVTTGGRYSLEFSFDQPEVRVSLQKVSTATADDHRDVRVWHRDEGEINEPA